MVVPSIDTIGADDLQYRLGGGLGVLGAEFIFTGCVWEASRGPWARTSPLLRGP